MLLVENLAPDRFALWTPPPGSTVIAGAEQQAVLLPAVPLPIHRHELTDEPPSDVAIGQGVYDYLRQFPDCAANVDYAELLREAYPHYLSDLAAHAVMLDAKQVEPAYVLRKLTCLKILALLDRRNKGLLLQLCRGYFELAFEFAELERCRCHLLEAMRFGQELLAIDPNDAGALSLLAEIDWFFGDQPAAIAKWRRLSMHCVGSDVAARIDARIAACASDGADETTLVDELEAVAEAMHLHTLGDHVRATMLLDRVEGRGRLTAAVPSADFYWLLGICRRDSGDLHGAMSALHRALELEPGHAAAEDALSSL